MFQVPQGRCLEIDARLYGQWAPRAIKQDGAGFSSVKKWGDAISAIGNFYRLFSFWEM
jgi:hypothetical protein